MNLYHFLLLLCFFVYFDAKAQSKQVKNALDIAAKHIDDPSHLSYLHKAAQLAVDNKDEKGSALVYGEIGKYYYNRLADSCIIYHHKAYKVLMDGGDKKNAAICLHSIAFAYDEMKKMYSTALDYVSNSIAMHEELKDTLEMANMYKYAGVLNGRMGMYNYARQNIDKAIELFAQKKMQSGIAVCWFDMGMVYAYAKKNDSAELYYQKAKQYQNNGHDAGRVFSINNQLLFLYIDAAQTKLADNIVKENEGLLNKNKVYYADRVTFYGICAGYCRRGQYTLKYRLLKDSLINCGIHVPD